VGHDVRIFFQRRRKLMLRLGALAVVGLGGLIAALPRADAQGPMWSGDQVGVLLAE
jgi:hypothetical protein